MKFAGPKTAQPRPAPPPPPMRNYSISNPFPGYGSQKPILFYEKNDPYYEFTNFSDHDVFYNGKRYPTSEHLFQSLKFLEHQPGIANDIRACETPRKAYEMARRYKHFARADWFKLNVVMMDAVLLLKFQQHRELRELLVSTGDAVLIENSPADSFWGIGQDQKGSNELGKALMRLRDKFRSGET
ncbi:hypothetical protein C0991_008580 [Blastosporella zonata]|nr:hypothetical protein C0991_008580 [Blastosporella zonata]